MQLPELNDISMSRDAVTVFGGYNRNQGASDAEFYDMKNMSSDSYPALSPRKPRGYVKTHKAILNFSYGVNWIAETQSTPSVKLSYTERNDIVSIHGGKIVERRSTSEETIEIELEAYDGDDFVRHMKQHSYLYHYDKSNGRLYISYAIGVKPIGKLEFTRNVMHDGEDIKELTFFNKDFSDDGMTAMCYIDGNEVWCNGRLYDVLPDSDKKRSIVSMGALLIVMPDGIIINTTTNVKETVDNEFVVTFSGNDGDGMTIKPCDASGEDIEYASQKDMPSNPANGDLWLDTSTLPHVMKRYSESQGQWVTQPENYVKLQYAYNQKTIAQGFSEGDSVDIEFPEGTEAFYGLENGNYIIKSRISNDEIVIVGIAYKSGTISTVGKTVSVKRTAPKMDFVIESGNRLWGCRAGENNKGDIVNEIYCSKLGDPKNWTVYEGISTDSYAATVGSDGVFTGAATYLGNPIFFKERSIHRVQGTIPANFQIQTTECRGLQKGSEESIAIVGDVMFYKSQNGICYYTGSTPTEVSDVFGGVKYDRAVGGGFLDKYYISMRNTATNKYDLFVFDTKKNVWHREDDSHLRKMASFDEMYFADEEGKLCMMNVDKSDAYERDIRWSCESGEIDCDTIDKKYLQRMTIDIRLQSGSTADVQIRYDSDEEWTDLFNVCSQYDRTYSMPITPRRFSSFRVKISGTGYAKILSVTKTYSGGSEE